MKNNLISSTILTFLCVLLFAGIYPALILGIAQLTPNSGKGFVTQANGKSYYTNIGQKFTDDHYFWSRPSAVDYNAAGSGGSNKGPSNPDYLATAQARIDTFLVHNPGIKKSDIPSDIVTASGSGLDPHISVQAAMIQVPRIARIRGISTERLIALVGQQKQSPELGLGPQRINVLLLNIALDRMTNSKQ